MLSDATPPAGRTFANSMNNLAFFAASMIAMILNAFVLPNIPGAFPPDDNLQIFRTSLYCAMAFFGLAFIASIFTRETCPDVLLRRRCRLEGKKYVR